MQHPVSIPGKITPASQEKHCHRSFSQLRLQTHSRDNATELRWKGNSISLHHESCFIWQQWKKELQEQHEKKVWNFEINLTNNKFNADTERGEQKGEKNGEKLCSGSSTAAAVSSHFLTIFSAVFSFFHLYVMTTSDCHPIASFQSGYVYCRHWHCSVFWFTTRFAPKSCFIYQVLCNIFQRRLRKALATHNSSPHIAVDFMFHHCHSSPFVSNN